MTLSPATELVSRVARAVAGAGSVDAALTAAAAEICDALHARTLVLVRSASSWRSLDRHGASLDGHAWLSCLSSITGGACATVRCIDGSTVATVVPIGSARPPDAALVVEGDWTAIEATLHSVSLVARLAVDSFRAREDKHHAGRQLIGGYAMARRLSRLGSIDTVAQQIVDSVAELIKADRVSLALYKSSEDALSIAATHGYPRSEVAEVRVRPGDWVLGHVFSSKRALFVSDVRVVPEMARRHSQYRSFSFAAVPLLAGRETVGVLTVTDKQESPAFSHADEILLRGLSVIAAVSLVAARSDHEASQLAYAATIDALTGLMNRPSLDKRLHQEIERGKRENASLAVLMADVDDFKRINDSHGHHVGDAVLRAIASVVRSAVRVFDVCARYGGDEFAVVMPNCDRSSAIACAERIRARLRDLRQQTRDVAWSGDLTLSIGVAVMGDEDDPSSLLQRADECLYAAKASGKNAVRSDEASAHVTLGPRPVPLRPVEVDPVAANQNARGHIPRLPYVLVVDTDEERLNVCLQAIRPFQCGLLVARTGSVAASLINQFGPPTLVAVDLLLQSGDAFSAIDTLPHDSDPPTDIVAWSASKQAREFAASKIRSGRILNTSAGNAPISAAIHSALQRQRDRQSEAARDPDAEGLAGLTSHLVDRVRAISPLPGVAIYLKDGAEDSYRLTVDWLPEDVPKSSLDVPSVFNRVRDSGRTVLHRDTLEDAGWQTDAIRGVIGVPIYDNGHVVGVICGYDVNPLRLDARAITALERLGMTVLQPHLSGRVIAATRSDLAYMADRRSDDRRAVSAGASSGAAGSVLAAWPAALLERSGGEFAVARELSRAKREGRQLSIVLFSVAPGRTVPEELPESDLDDIATTLVKAVRQSDLPIRWSVTELLVVLPGLGTKEAKAVAERVRAALSAGTKNRVPVSGGVEEIDHDVSFLDVIDRARQKVAIAFDRGHNRIV